MHQAEAIAKRRNGKPTYLPVINAQTERSIEAVVLYATRYVFHPSTESLIDLEIAVHQLAANPWENKS